MICVCTPTVSHKGIKFHVVLQKVKAEKSQVACFRMTVMWVNNVLRSGGYHLDCLAEDWPVDKQLQAERDTEASVVVAEERSDHCEEYEDFIPADNQLHPSQPSVYPCST